jgi:hypothetical protein
MSILLHERSANRFRRACQCDRGCCCCVVPRFSRGRQNRRGLRTDRPRTRRLAHFRSSIPRAPAFINLHYCNESGRLEPASPCDPHTAQYAYSRVELEGLRGSSLNRHAFLTSCISTNIESCATNTNVDLAVLISPCSASQPLLLQEECRMTRYVKPTHLPQTLVPDPTASSPALYSFTNLGTVVPFSPSRT